MSQLSKLTDLLNALNSANGRYEASYEVSRKSIKASVIRNDDLVTILTVDADRQDTDYTIEVNASIAYLEALICKNANDIQGE